MRTLQMSVTNEKKNHYGFEEIGCKEPQSFQNSITCYTGLLKIK